MILNYIQNFENFWKRKGYEILLILSIMFLLIGGIYMYIKKNKGTWDTRYDIENILINTNRLKLNQNRKGERRDKLQYSNYSENSNKGESKGETECKRVLEKIFNKPFNKVRPDFLRNQVTGNTNNLEIDCFNDELKIGLEYNGRQHYDFIPFFHRNKETFYNQKYRDELKRIKCRDNGILLIEVPYTIKIEDIEKYIKKDLRDKLKL
jgi:hypothetical protein